MARFLAAQRHQAVIMLDCGLIRSVASNTGDSGFTEKLQHAISDCLSNETPDAYMEGLKSLAPGVLADLDGRLQSPVTLFIYRLDKLPESEVQSQSRALQCLRILLKSVHFRILLAADYEIDLGEAMPHITHQSMNGCEAGIGIMMGI